MSAAVEGAETLGVAADESETGGFAILHFQQGVGGDGRGGHIRVGEEEADGGEVLDGEPEGAPIDAQAGGPTTGFQLRKPPGPAPRRAPGRGR